MRFRQLFAIITLAGLPMLTHAATIVEGVDYVDAPNVNIGPLAAGSHTISGTLAGTCLGGSPSNCQFGADPEDILTISIAPAAELVGVSFTFSNDATLADQFGMGFGYISSADGFFFNGLLAGVYAAPPPNPVGGDITLFLTADNAAGVLTYQADWTLNLTVAAVPLPASLSMLGVSLMGLVALRRRRQSI